MNLATKQHPIEILVEWVAPALLAAAAGWATNAAALPIAASLAAVAATFAAGLLIMRLAGGRPAIPVAQFEPTVLELTDVLDPDELLLDDPLVEVTADARVVRLFAKQEPTPGELVERIADFLGDSCRPAPAAEKREEAQLPVDASIALHSALANIRASLR